jgi:APA family basic amino acid/polyamine antiporter
MLTATSIGIADMVGVGVFTSLGFQVKDIQSGFSLIMLWVIGGAVALCGALSYAELATAFPRSGGEYNFLSRIYHRAIGFMAGFVSATVGFSAPIALAAMALGRYFEGVFPGLPPILGVKPALIVGLIAVWGITAVHLAGVREGSWFQNISTIIKLGLIFAFLFVGFFATPAQPISFAPSVADLAVITSAPFAISLVFVMYSYSGWNAATYIAGEIRDPARDLPRSIILSVLGVTVLYVALNAVFLYTTPISQLSGQVEVALVAGRQIFGDFGGRFAAALICVGLISTISAMTWIGPRVTMVIGEDMPFFRSLARKSSTGTPVAAILLQVTIVTLLVLTQRFEEVIEYIQFSLTLCSFLAVLGVIVLRYTQPNLPRPHRVWGYPITPFIFLLVTLWMMGYQLARQPNEALAGLLTLAAGLLIYALSARYRRDTVLQTNT